MTRQRKPAPSGKRPRLYRPVECPLSRPLIHRLHPTRKNHPHPTPTAKHPSQPPPPRPPPHAQPPPPPPPPSPPTPARGGNKRGGGAGGGGAPRRGRPGGPPGAPPDEPTNCHGRSPPTQHENRLSSACTGVRQRR